MLQIYEIWHKKEELKTDLPDSSSDDTDGENKMDSLNSKVAWDAILTQEEITTMPARDSPEY